MASAPANLASHTPSTPPTAPQAAFVNVDGFKICSVDVSHGQPDDHQACWLILDRAGRIVGRARSELLAIAKVQILLLAALTKNPGTRSSTPPDWTV